jgi:hypothetical protein
MAMLGGRIMETNKKILLLLGFITIFCFGVALIGLNNQAYFTKETNISQPVKMIDRIIPAGNIPSQYLASTNTVTIHAVEPATPSSFPLFRGVFRDGDKLDVILGDSLKKKTNVISEQDAPKVAAKAMISYGGIPPDAELGVSRTVNLEKFEPSTGEILESHPLYTAVSYHRKINGMPVGGQSDKLDVDLGENGTVLRIYKIWRTLEPIAIKVAVISPNKAVDRLQSGQVLDPPLDVNKDVQINSISLGYYETSRMDPEIILQPIWFFYGKTSSGSEIRYYVYARQFAGFTQTPAVMSKTVAGKTTAVKDPFTVTFTDTSDASPMKWQWDFGDGTASAEQNPTHTYKTAGTYNVTLTAWNELGSDTLVRQYTVIPEK